MSYKSKRTLTSIIAGILLSVAYVVYALGENSPEPENLKDWASLMLIFIGIGVCATIVLQILFHIAFSIGIAVKENGDDEKTERIISAVMVEDEMEKLISLKSNRVGASCVGIGFIAALISLILGVSTIFMMHILLGSFVFGSILEGTVSICLYERGVRNG